MSRKTRFILVALLLVAFFGYRQYREHARDASADNVAVARTGRCAAGHAAQARQPRVQALHAGIAVRRARRRGAVRHAGGGGKPGAARRAARSRSTSPGSRPTRTAATRPTRCSCSPAGPGQSATASYPTVAPAFREVLKQRDVILVDQRGTGESNPLQCKTLADDDASLDEAASLQAMRAAVDALPRRAVEARRPALLHHHRRGARPGQRAQGDRRGDRSTWSASPTAPASPSSTRAPIPATRARWCWIRWRRTTSYLGNDFARNLESALDLQFGRCDQDAGLRQGAGRSARAAATR